MYPKISEPAASPKNDSPVSIPRHQFHLLNREAEHLIKLPFALS
jgi:hypothetical protein